jgi:hypothetical protein
LVLLAAEVAEEVEILGPFELSLDRLPAPAVRVGAVAGLFFQAANDSRVLAASIETRLAYGSGGSGS